MKMPQTFKKFPKIVFRAPDKGEWALFIFGFIMFGILDYAQNAFQVPHTIHYMTVFGIEAITLFWISVLLYHLALFTAFYRAIHIRGTHHFWDWLVGTVAFIGVYFLIVGGIAAIYYLPNQAVPWIFGFAQITAYHIFGVGFQVAALLYFMFTD